MPPYQPPALERGAYVGEWAGSGVRLELDAQGGVMAEKLPVDDGFGVADRCSGRGTWEHAGGSAGGYGPGVVLSVAECEEASLYWQVAGSEEEPQLFVLIGDPDSGDVRVLRKRAR